MSSIWIAAACCLTGARLPFGQRPSRCCVIWSKIPAVLFRRTSSLPRCGRIWRSPTMRWCRASANCGGRLADDGPRLIKTIPRRGYRFESAVSIDRARRPVHGRCHAGFGGFPATTLKRRSPLSRRLHGHCWLRRSPAGAADCSPLLLRGFACCRGAVDRSLRLEFFSTPRSGEQFSKTAELARNRQSPFSPL